MTKHKETDDVVPPVLPWAVIKRDATNVLYDWCPASDFGPWLLAYIDKEGVLCMDSCGGPFAISKNDAIGFTNDLRRLAMKAKPVR